MDKYVETWVWPGLNSLLKWWKLHPRLQKIKWHEVNIITSDTILYPAADNIPHTKKLRNYVVFYIREDLNNRIQTVLIFSVDV